jgi:hypothetical protein
MNIVGISTRCTGDAMAVAFKKSGYRLRKKAVSWPRMKGVAGVRIDCGTGYAVEVLRNANSLFERRKAEQVKAAWDRIAAHIPMLDNRTWR